MSLAVLIFVNLGRQDVHVWAVEGDGDMQFAAKLASGASIRLLSPAEQKWSVVAGESYEIAASDKNRIFIVGAGGVYEADRMKGLTAESGAIPADFDYPAGGLGGWP
jgi:hypothetical protein